MAVEPFMQGPMTDDEARELAKRYRAAGRKVSITESFQPGLKYVQVQLPTLKFAPRSSNVYQQKMWK